jgi:hypothetical protein
LGGVERTIHCPLLEMLIEAKGTFLREGFRNKRRREGR